MVARCPDSSYAYAHVHFTSRLRTPMWFRPLLRVSDEINDFLLDEVPVPVDAFSRPKTNW